MRVAGRTCAGHGTARLRKEPRAFYVARFVPARRLLRLRRRSHALTLRRFAGRARGNAALAVLVLGASAFAVAAGNPGTGSWRTVPGPDVPDADSANLTAVAMASPSVGWASGFTLANSAQNAPSEPLLAAWNGHHWRAVPVGIATAKGGRLDGLAVRSVSDAWAVGRRSARAKSSHSPCTGTAAAGHWCPQRACRATGSRHC